MNRIGVMGFEETFTAYLVGDKRKDPKNNMCHFEYKKLKNDLNFCRRHRDIGASTDSHGDGNSEDDLNQIVPHRSCHRNFPFPFSFPFVLLIIN